ncbi:MAG: hypothetical protein ACOY94_10520 [Bacillota bacterium]
MSEQKSNAIVNLLKKSVGIRENASGCCGTENLAGASEASSCCGTASEAKSTQATSTGCCGSDSASSGSCCG